MTSGSAEPRLRGMRSLRCSGVAQRGKATTPVWQAMPLPARGRSASETWTWILVAAGVFLRVLEYSDNRQLYRDEADLQKNLVGFAFYDFHTPLVEWQLAPPGFLAVERLMILLPLPFAPAARLVPFICSIASMFLMRSVARRYLTAAAVPIAVGLFALTDWMLYYSVEIKQYSSDVALTLTALLLAAGPARSARKTGRRDSRGATSSFSPHSERSASGSLIRWRLCWRAPELISS